MCLLWTNHLTKSTRFIWISDRERERWNGWLLNLYVQPWGSAEEQSAATAGHSPWRPQCPQRSSLAQSDQDLLLIDHPHCLDMMRASWNLWKHNSQVPLKVTNSFLFPSCITSNSAQRYIILLSTTKNLNQCKTGIRITFFYKLIIPSIVIYFNIWVSTRAYLCVLILNSFFNAIYYSHFMCT